MRTARVIEVPAGVDGMRLDRFLALRFRDWSRTALARAVRAGEVRDAADRPLRASAPVRAGLVLRVYTEGIAATGAPPPFPPILYEDDRVIVLAKPAGMLAHPTGTRFTWAAVSLAKARWPEQAIDLVHRLDRDTSGVLILTRDPDANRFLKAKVKAGAFFKEYEAIVRGAPTWDDLRCEGPIGAADGAIRIQMAVRPDGLPARTDVRVLARSDAFARVACVLHTGRTHQIRVHLAHAGHALLGDRMYGVPESVFLHYWEHGVDASVVTAAGAPRQALHAARVRFPHPDGGDREVNAPFPDDLQRWWDHPEVLPLDDWTPEAVPPDDDGETEA